jgi:hypothetical protein
MQRKPHTFVPSLSGPLEDRALLSKVPMFHGLPAITQTAYNRAFSRIVNSFNQFGSSVRFNHVTGAVSGNYNRLASNLVAAVQAIPYHHADGLDFEMANIAFQLQTDVNNGVVNPVYNARVAALSTLSSDIGARLSSGTVVYSPR